MNFVKCRWGCTDVMASPQLVLPSSPPFPLSPFHHRLEGPSLMMIFSPVFRARHAKAKVRAAPRISPGRIRVGNRADGHLQIRREMEHGAC
jgi:hypothetical protein